MDVLSDKKADKTRPYDFCSIDFLTFCELQLPGKLVYRNHANIHANCVYWSIYCHYYNLFLLILYTYLWRTFQCIHLVHKSTNWYIYRVSRIAFVSFRIHKIQLYKYLVSEMRKTRWDTLYGKWKMFTLTFHVLGH